jgi:hypothetical protein
MTHRWRIHSTTAVVSTLLLALTLAATAACTADKPEPQPRPVVDRDTIAAAELGERLTITARVVRTLDSTAFVVQDVDLPTGGLLVVARDSVDVRPPILVSVRGTVRTFHYADHANAGLGPRTLYEAFEGQRAVMADRVTVWSGAAPPTSTGPSA